MPTKTAPSPADRLAAAVAAALTAHDRLTELRERHKLGADPVTAEEFGSAGHAVELAELERQGAEDALAAAERQARLAELARIAADIEALADPGITADEEDQAAAAITRRLTRNTEVRSAVAAVTNRLKGLGVEQCLTGQPADGDAGLAWRGTGSYGAAPYVRSGGCVVRSEDPGVIMQRILAAAAAKAGLAPAAMEPLR